MSSFTLQGEHWRLERGMMKVSWTTDSWFAVCTVEKRSIGEEALRSLPSTDEVVKLIARSPFKKALVKKRCPTFPVRFAALGIPTTRSVPPWTNELEEGRPTRDLRNFRRVRHPVKSPSANE